MKEYRAVIILYTARYSAVRVEGLEPPCLAASDPKSDTSTNFATPAKNHDDHI